MQMKAISKYYGLDLALEKSINAGVDVMMFGNNVTQTDKLSASLIHATIKNLVLSGKISEKRIDEAYIRIIALKSKSFNVDKNKVVLSQEHYEMVNDKKAKHLIIADAVFDVNKGLFFDRRMDECGNFTKYINELRKEHLYSYYKVSTQTQTVEETQKNVLSQIEILMRNGLSPKNIFIAIDASHISIINDVALQYPKKTFHFLLLNAKPNIEFIQLKKSKQQIILVQSQDVFNGVKLPKNIRCLHYENEKIASQELMNVYNWIDEFMIEAKLVKAKRKR
jgi:hypothetical protein